MVEERVVPMHQQGKFPALHWNSGSPHREAFMAIYAFIAIILVFVAGIGYQAFSLTSDIDGRIAGGAGAITAAILGACILIGLFIFLMRRQHQRDRNEHRGDPS